MFWNDANNSHDRQGRKSEDLTTELLHSLNPDRFASAPYHSNGNGTLSDALGESHKLRNCIDGALHLINTSAHPLIYEYKEQFIKDRDALVAETPTLEQRIAILPEISNAIDRASQQVIQAFTPRWIYAFLRKHYDRYLHECIDHVVVTHKKLRQIIIFDPEADPFHKLVMTPGVKCRFAPPADVRGARGQSRLVIFDLPDGTSVNTDLRICCRATEGNHKLLGLRKDETGFLPDGPSGGLSMRLQVDNFGDLIENIDCERIDFPVGFYEELTSV